MSNGAVVATAATRARATKASGSIVRVAPDDFLSILSRSVKPLVIKRINAKSGIFALLSNPFLVNNGKSKHS